jgi:hypothetical protein
MNDTHNHIDDVPISLKSAVGEAGLEGSHSIDAFEEGVVVAAQL